MPEKHKCHKFLRDATDAMLKLRLETLARKEQLLALNGQPRATAAVPAFMEAAVRNDLKQKMLPSAAYIICYLSKRASE